MTKLFNLTTSMGLKLKPRKCKSLSISAGKSKEIVFALGDSEIGSLLHESFHKFLGGFYTFKCSASDAASILLDRISVQLKNVDDLLVRNEYKVRIYSEYLLGSNRFLFSIHDLSSNQIGLLESLTRRYLKDWLGIPKGGTWALVHDIHGLNIKSIRHLYLESRSLSLSNIRRFGDENVRHALDWKEAREGEWRLKFSSATYARDLIQEVAPPNVEVQDVISEAGDGLDGSFGSSVEEEEWGAAAPALVAAPTVARAQAEGPLTRKLLKGKIQAGVQKRVNDFWREKVGAYIMQGDYLALHMEEQSCLTWRSFLWDIPQGVLKFAINAGINTLPSGDNLKRWGKRVSDRCGFCGNVQTLAHILSNCTTALDQGRFTWRHDSVLKTIVTFVHSKTRPGLSLFSDLRGFQSPHGGVIPPHILVTPLRPDLFLVDEVDRIAVLFELTCPWESNIERSHSFKEAKYAPLVADLSHDFRVFHYSVEISARGFISKQNRARLKAFTLKCCDVRNADITSLVKNCSKASLLASFSIFQARNEPSWSSPLPLAIRT